ncbi:cytochrome c-type biogenesis protein [Salinimonas lutimaris]|uniref:cytochrome c-type biogenesis protein n=1 Tax=Salinimonas lutimaris TaxID=914153 RepID=UPI0010C029C0|nr:cytochrome c-type biogenesis protein [Salinimonas lutimaris]
MKSLVCSLLLLLFSTAAISADNRYNFNSQQDRALFLTLTAELRCPMCQNQNIADSDAMIAHDMRRKVASLIRQGKSEQEIIDYMKARYGDFVYYEPPVTVATVWLWVLPVLFTLGGLILVLRKRSAPADADTRARLQKADQLLERDK